ncbi:MAG: hypothetical protein HQL95_00790 [Magnetococcales bacterium]|nr:hypothetical protein [Magnetococcales bacterium]
MTTYTTSPSSKLLATARRNITAAQVNIDTARTALETAPDRFGLAEDYLHDAEIAITNALQEIEEWIADAENALVLDENQS